MKRSTRIAGIVFLTLAFADVLSIAIGGNNLHFFIKPFLMPSLAVTALLQLLPEHNCKLTWLMLTGLCFHTLGDILLMFDSKGFVYFAAGLGAFMVGHFFYLAVLLSGMGGFKSWKEVLCLVGPLALAPVLVGLFGVEWPFSAVVTIYAFTLMCVAASGALWSIRKKEFACRIFWGGLIFIISDSLIAVSAFAGIDFPFRGTLVMLTYLLAEWLLVSGMIAKISSK